MERGFIKIWRKVMDSSVWIGEGQLFKLFVWCIMKASHRDKAWVSYKSGKGEAAYQISRGEFLFGRHSAAQELKWHPSTTWQRINSLKKMGLIDIKSDRLKSIIKVINYDVYAGAVGEDEQVTRQAIGKLMTGQRTANDTKENYNNYNNNTGIYNNTTKVSRTNKPPQPPRGGRFAPPVLAQVQEYILEKEYNVDPEAWMSYYQSNGWKVGKNPMKDWKASIRHWASKQKEKKPEEVGYYQLHNPFKDEEES